MLKRLVAGPLVAAIAMFFWGFVLWPILGLATGVVSELPNETVVMKTLELSGIETGVYAFPQKGFGGTDEEQRAWARRHERGPLGMLLVRRPGVAPGGTTFLLGLLHLLASAMLAAIILERMLPAADGYGQRVAVVTLLGLFAAVAIHPAGAVWWYHPWPYTLYSMFATASSWLLAGLVLAAFVRPEN